MGNVSSVGFWLGQEHCWLSVVFTEAQPDKIVAIAIETITKEKRLMWILIAEMLLALGIIVFIMWWTMRARVDHAAPEEQIEPSELKGGESAKNANAVKEQINNESSSKG